MRIVCIAILSQRIKKNKRKEINITEKPINKRNEKYKEDENFERKGH